MASKAKAVASKATEEVAVPPFGVIPGYQVRHALEGREAQIVEAVEAAYRLHCSGDTVNPPSYFLRFNDRPSARIIALPASIGGGLCVDGLKWIAGFPDNVAAGIPRASAVLILNDHDTGYPFACLEGSIISANRTAALAASAAFWLSRDRLRPRRIGFVGAGLIARYIHTFFAATGWSFDKIGVYDLAPASAAGFCDYLKRFDASGQIQIEESAEQLIRSSEMVVFATTAAQPHVSDVTSFEHNPLVLNVSLRDLAPEIVLASANVVDDIDHCLRANTSPHLAEQLAGNREFLQGTLGDVMAGRVTVPANKPLVFSPFGLGILDLAVGKYVYDEVAACGELQVIDAFFDQARRYG